jgi:hypothetical protein
VGKKCGNTFKLTLAQERIPMQTKPSPTTNPNATFLPPAELLPVDGSAAATVELDLLDGAGGDAVGGLTPNNASGNKTLSTG